MRPSFERGKQGRVNKGHSVKDHPANQEEKVEFYKLGYLVRHMNIEGIELGSEYRVHEANP